jgi:hypothetical protein
MVANTNASIGRLKPLLASPPAQVVFGSRP